MILDVNTISLNDLWLVLKILSIPAVLKLYLLMQSLRMYGVYRLFMNRENIYSHEIFTMLDKLYTDEELFNRISDTARREIFKDVLKVEVMSLNEILIAFREYIYKEDNFFRFMFSNRHLDGKSLMRLFLRFYNAHRDKVGKKIKIKLKVGGLDQKRIMYITQKYYEFTEENSYILRKKIELLRDRQNMFFSVTDILDRIKIEIESRKIFFPEKFSKLNGKLNHVTYKGYDSFTETNSKLQVIQEAE